MQAPAHSLRLVFALSVLTCSVILVLFVLGRASPTDGFWVQVGGAALAVSAVVCFLAFRHGGLRLQGVSVGDLFFAFLRSLLVAYVVSVAVVTLVGFLMLFSLTHTAPHALALASLAGLWLSVWFAPGVAAVTSWRRLRCRAPG